MFITRWQGDCDQEETLIVTWVFELLPYRLFKRRHTYIRKYGKIRHKKTELSSVYRLVRIRGPNPSPNMRIFINSNNLK